MSSSTITTELDSATRPSTVSSRVDTTTAVLGALLVAGVYADGWAHLNVPGLETFFTPWHALLYTAFTLLAGWVIGQVWRHHRRSGGHWATGPTGYRLGLAGIAVFGVGGLLDMAWHVAFGIETGVDALVSPTHLMLLTGGTLLLTTPWRSRTSRPDNQHPWPAIVALATATALAGFFLAYVSVFVDPSPMALPLTSIPEGAPGHQAGELPTTMGLAAYLITTALLTLPILLLTRHALTQPGAISLIAAAAALPAAALTSGAYLVPALAAVAAATVLDLTRHRLAPIALAGLLPAAVAAAHLAALAATGRLAWPVPLWAGTITLTGLAGLVLAVLSGAPQSALHSRRS